MADSAPPHNVWGPEVALNGLWICVRYVYGMKSVAREVRSDEHGQPIYFKTVRAALAAAEGGHE